MARVQVPDHAAASPTSYVYSHYSPTIGKAAASYSYAVYEHSLMSTREMEAARYRTAQINGCLLCQEHRASTYDTHLPGQSEPMERPFHARGEVPGEDFYAAIADWRGSSVFSERERLAIEFAERMGLEPQSFQGDEALWARLHAHFSDAEIVDMTFSIGSWVAAGRVTHILELDQGCHLPKREAA